MRKYTFYYNNKTKQKLQQPIFVYKELYARFVSRSRNKLVLRGYSNFKLHTFYYSRFENNINERIIGSISIIPYPCDLYTIQNRVRKTYIIYNLGI